VRRLLPWALVGLVGIGAGVGAALGQANAPGTAAASPAQWVARVLATTKAAGTAHLHFTEVTASSNPDLRGSSAGSGVVDFAAGTFRVSDIAHQLDWTIGPTGQVRTHPETFGQKEIAVGPAVYQSIGTDDPLSGWIKETAPRDDGAIGLGSADGFADPLLSLTAPYTVRRVRDLVRASLGGESTTRYLVESRLRLHCPKSATATRQPMQRTTLWIDGQGRLMQARSASYSSGKIPAADLKSNPQFADEPTGSSTSVTTLRISGFGRPVHVAAPAVVVYPPDSSTVTIRLGCAS
jgi:hypothetical protein